jgi:hypothetical protein
MFEDRMTTDRVSGRLRAGDESPARAIGREARTVRFDPGGTLLRRVHCGVPQQGPSHLPTRQLAGTRRREYALSATLSAARQTRALSISTA